MDRLPTGVVTFLFTDIEGSTQLIEEHPDAMREALGRHHALLQGVFAAHRGRVFKVIGDAFCAVFEGAGDALAWGLADRVVPAAELDAAVSAVAADLAKGGPVALAEAKMLVDDVVASPASLVPELTAARIARLRATAEAQEGMTGFLEKRPPRWVK